MTRNAPALLLVCFLACLSGLLGCRPESGARAAGPRAGASDATQGPTLPAETRPEQQGVDVSWHSGTVDWTQVAAQGYGFAFAKATEGITLVDKEFESNWAGMKAAGLLRGAYHFYVTEDDPGNQADNFIKTAPLGAGDLIPVVDIETLGHGTVPDLADRLQTWLTKVEEHFGVRPMIYTAPDFWDANLDDRFGDYPLWIAEYEVDAPRLPTGWKAWTLWQWKEDVKIDGAPGGADLNRANPAGPDLSTLLIPE